MDMGEMLDRLKSRPECELFGGPLDGTKFRIKRSRRVLRFKCSEREEEREERAKEVKDRGFGVGDEIDPLILDVYERDGDKDVFRYQGQEAANDGAKGDRFDTPSDF